MGLLSGSQQFFIHRLAKLYIDKNLDLSSSEMDDNLAVVDGDDYNFVDKMCKSKSPVDRRFLEFFRIMKDEPAIPIDDDLSILTDKYETSRTFQKDGNKIAPDFDTPRGPLEPGDIS